MLALLAVVGLAAGILNYAAAGGSLLPFLVMVMLGMPPLVANATCLAATPLSFVRVIGDIRKTPRMMRIPLVCAVAATAVGVWLVSRVVTEEGFRRAVPYLLVCSVALLLVFRRVAAWIDARTGRSGMSARSTTTVLTLGITVTSAYAGAFGGGVGVLILGVLTVATSWSWDTINTTKNTVCLTTSVVGFIAFAFTGLVRWPLWVALAAGMLLGSYVGRWATQHVPASIQRLVVAVTTTLSAAYLWASP
ncbi:hypothetical protein EV192_1289 [Actinocrispum wychmicini]|uniref:Probable membrane transporter protein n=2 Tax=Actinocrispum wychmicini TaxID=1213861 RepID=A0A4R2IHT1_9PSEU|nr:hypothetical protein EV192_1289 [Actinocrispum wychmicini]